MRHSEPQPSRSSPTSPPPSHPLLSPFPLSRLSIFPSLPLTIFYEADSSRAVSTVPLLRGVLTRRPLVEAQTQSAALSALIVLPFSPFHRCVTGSSLMS